MVMVVRQGPSTGWNGVVPLAVECQAVYKVLQAEGGGNTCRINTVPHDRWHTCDEQLLAAVTATRIPDIVQRLPIIQFLSISD